MCCHNKNLYFCIDITKFTESIDYINLYFVPNSKDCIDVPVNAFLSLTISFSNHRSQVCSLRAPVCTHLNSNSSHLISSRRLDHHARVSLIPVIGAVQRGGGREQDVVELLLGLREFAAGATESFEEGPR